MIFIARNAYEQLMLNTIFSCVKVRESKQNLFVLGENGNKMAKTNQTNSLHLFGKIRKNRIRS